MRIDPVVAVLGGLTLVAFTTGAVLRFLVDVLAVDGDVLSVIAAAAVGSGMLLFAATLVVAVIRNRLGRLPVVIGTCALLVTLAAVVAGVLPVHADVATVFRLTTLRTALVAIAGACLPAVVVGALASRGRRGR
jgi:hypothetical protein